MRCIHFSLLLLSLTINAKAAPKDSVLVLPEYFQVTPGGVWSEPEGDTGPVGPIQLSFQAFTSEDRPKESLILGAVKVLDPDKIPDPSLREIDAKRMVQFMVSSIRPAEPDEKLEMTEPSIRPIKELGPAEYFYTFSFGEGADAARVSGITMGAEGGASAIQIIWPKSAGEERYDSKFWRQLIKTIKPLEQGTEP